MRKLWIFQLKIILNPISNAIDGNPKGFMKLKLCLTHDDQHMTETDYAFVIKTSDLLLLYRPYA